MLNKRIKVGATVSSICQIALPKVNVLINSSRLSFFKNFTPHTFRLYNRTAEKSLMNLFLIHADYWDFEPREQKITNV